MSENLSSQDLGRLADDLRRIPAFAGLPDDHMTWLLEHFEEVRLAPGEIFLRPGDPAVWLTVVLEGEIRLQRENAADGPVYSISAGQVTGYLPYSRLTHFRATGRAVTPTRLVRMHRDNFPEMLHKMPELGHRLVAVMADRIRETARMESQRDKLAALGKLSAGLAHELNNPAAAARRAAASLREIVETVRQASLRLARHKLSPEEVETIIHFEQEASQAAQTPQLDPLARSDREERISAWLEERQVADAWKIAPVLADGGVEVPGLDGLAARISPELLGDALVRIGAILTIFRLLNEIEHSTKRMSDLVLAIKEYSYMDRAAMQDVDLHQGLESTLAILGHRLKGGIRVVREYDKDLPRVCAFGGELNQVWTNLIDNAIEAMQGKGELHLRTARELDRVLVEIRDNGPGIPADVQPHIFEPFFTTKDVGEGTGLGLDTVCRIVRNHHGEIKMTSKPGDTCFQVYLPATQPTAAP